MATDTAGPKEEQSWEIDVFRPADAAGVVALYRAVYGENYPMREVYDPQTLIRQGETGEAYRVVVRTTAGEVVGHMAFYRSSPPNPRLYESGQLMVRQDYRLTDMAFKLSRYSIKEIPLRHGLAQIWGEAVCNHIFTQRMCKIEDFYETALEIDLMPAESYEKAFTKSMDNTGRVSTLIVFKTFKTRGQTIYLPSVYEESLQYLYSAADFGHRYIRSDAPFPASVTTKGEIQLFPTAGVARLTFEEIGGDFESCLDGFEKQAETSGSVVVQVFLKLTQPWTGAAVDVLRRHGYFLGGILPRWFDDDGLLMQKIGATPNFGGIHLYSKRAKKILEIVKNDWQAVTEGQ